LRRISKLALNVPVPSALVAGLALGMPNQIAEMGTDTVATHLQNFYIVCGTAIPVLFVALAVQSTLMRLSRSS
jgi:hypothetical protein